MKIRTAVFALLLATPAWPALADDGQALHEAARKGDLATVRALLDKGVKPDSPGRHGLTPLGVAASTGNFDVVRLLVERGANVNARESFFGSSVLEQATRGKYPEIVRWLLEKGSTDADGALYFAVETGDVAMA